MHFKLETARTDHFFSSQSEMQEFIWSPNEKRIARTVFERAAVAEEQDLLKRFKIQAAAAKSLEDLWALQVAIQDTEREYQQKYDYRYSQLIFVFARLLREGRVSIDELYGLSEDKLKIIERVASL